MYLSNLLSSFLLFSMRYVRYWMAFWYTFLMRDLMFGWGMVRPLSFFFIYIIKCSCMTPLTPVMTVMTGVTFHSLFLRVFISGLYLVCFCTRACLGIRHGSMWFLKIRVCVHGRGLLVFG